MAKSRITLSADKRLIERERRLAKRDGTTLSSLFSRYPEVLLRQR